MVELPPGWTLAATSFNWTPELLRAERSAIDITTDILSAGIASVIEVEAGQVWRGFPTPTDSEIDALRDGVEAHGGRISMIGASIDEWDASDRRRDDDERFFFLEPQIRAAARVGAGGVRLPLGQASPVLLGRILPLLHELELTLFEEIQGQQSRAVPSVAAALDAIAALDDSRVRVLVDCSMLMPALPPSYIDLLDRAGLPPGFIAAIRDHWKDPSTQDAVMHVLRSGAVPGHIHTLFMNMVIRYGRQSAADLRDILPLVSGFHLKFWDLDDADARVSQPLRELGAELTQFGQFEGTFCSEWGGHDWITADAGQITRDHLGLAHTALAEGAAEGR